MAVNSLTSGQSPLAAELMLNKIMNGQVATNTGKTITAAGRALSSTLNNEAYEAGAAEVNMSYGKGLVAAAQTQVTGARATLDTMIKDLNAAINGGATLDLFKKMSADMEATFGNLSGQIKGATFNGQALFGDTALELNAGMGQKINILGNEVGADTTDFGKVADTLTDLSATDAAGLAADSAAAVAALEAAVNYMIGLEAGYAQQVKELDNRALVLGDMSATIKDAASGQTITSSGGANSLLNNLLGGNTSA